MHLPDLSGDEPWVTADEAGLIPHRLRLAWAASVCEKVLDLFSPYFRRRYLQDDALDLAWTYAVTGQKPRQMERLFESMKDLIPDAEDEDYGRNAISPGMLLLADVADDTPVDSVAAVENAAVMFAAHHVYRRGMSSFDPVVSQDYQMQLEMPVYRLARALYSAATQEPCRAVQRGMFGSIGLDPPIIPRGLEVPRATPSRPPPHEVEFIKQRGWAWT